MGCSNIFIRRNGHNRAMNIKSFKKSIQYICNTFAFF